MLPPPDFGKIKHLNELHRVLHTVRLPVFQKQISGWMTFREQRALYALARFSDGPILEIGAWLGRSTVCIGRGIVDSGRPKKFLTCELAPTMANFRPLSEKTMGFFYPPESEMSMGIARLEMFENDIKPIISNPKGVIGQLKENLAALNVADAVSIFIGDFRQSPHQHYKFVFTDAMHDEKEITRNAPDLCRFLEPGSILACHDTTPENEQLLQKYFQFGHSFVVDSLFIGEIKSFKG
jgi:Methyltransferase domain